MAPNKRILALDIGVKRIGIATASPIAQLPTALPTALNDAMFFERLRTIISQEDIGLIVVGWPTNLSGQTTSQTDYVAAFIERLRQQFSDIPITITNETLTSVEAEADMAARHQRYTKGDIDARAAE